MREFIQWDVQLKLFGSLDTNIYMKCTSFDDVKTLTENEITNHCRFRSLSTQINSLKFIRLIHLMWWEKAKFNAF